MEMLEEVEIKLDYSVMDRRIILPRLATADGFVQQARRTNCVHMSGILKPLAIAAKQLKPNTPDEDEYPLMWALGVAWEEFVASLYPTMDYQPGEVIIDGIAMTCDGINWLPQYEENCIEEMKSTYESSTNPISWMKQQQAARNTATGTGHAFTVRWHSCHLRGDYKSWKPCYMRRTVRFSDKEVEQTHQMFVKNIGLAIAEKGSN